MAVFPQVSIDTVQFGTPAADTLNGGVTNNLIHAGAGDDTVNGLAGRDVLYGDRGADIVNGNSGNDTLVWNNGDGSDTLSGGSGTDTLVTESGSTGETFTLNTDTGNLLLARTSNPAFQLSLQQVETVDLWSQGGDDRLTMGDLSGTTVTQVHFHGGTGDDRVTASASSTPLVAEGESGNDTLTGGTGSDQLQGGSGNDPLRGGAGNDWLLGGTGNDSLSGGNGRDVLEGGAGNDQLTGGAGRDAFVFNPNEGDDTVRDFTSGVDSIVLKGFSGTTGQPATFADLTGQITTAGGDSVIDLGGTTITVSNVTALTQNDFVFV